MPTLLRQLGRMRTTTWLPIFWIPDALTSAVAHFYQMAFALVYHNTIQYNTSAFHSMHMHVAHVAILSSAASIQPVSLCLVNTVGYYGECYRLDWYPCFSCMDYPTIWMFLPGFHQVMTSNLLSVYLTNPHIAVPHCSGQSQGSTTRHFCLWFRTISYSELFWSQCWTSWWCHCHVLMVEMIAREVDSLMPLQDSSSDMKMFSCTCYQVW